MANIDLHFIYNLSILFNVVTGGVAALFLLFTAYKTNAVARSLAHLALADVGWALTHLLAQITENPDTSLLLNKWSVLFTVIIGFCGFDFAIHAIQSVTGRLPIIWHRVGQALCSFFILLITSDIVWNTGFLINEENYALAWGAIWPGKGLFFNFFPVYFIGSFIVSYFLLSKTLSTPNISEDSRQQIKYFNLSLFIASFGGVPYWLNWYGILVPPLGGLLIPLYIFGLFYSITKFKLFNIRVITAELFIITVWMLMFGRFFLLEGGNFYLDIGIFSSTVLFGLLAIRSVLTIETQKEVLENTTRKLDVANRELFDLNNNLQQKVDEQTKEIKKAYEIEKQARIELERLNETKDNFLLTTQHHLRTPLTVVKGFLELALEEGTFSDTVRVYLEKATGGVLRMVSLINEFLDVSQFKMGSMGLNRQPINLLLLVSEIKEEIISEIEKKGLKCKVSFTKEASLAKVSIDYKAMKAALYNLIDNAVKYTKEGGIEITGEVVIHPIDNTKIFRLKIADTGMGISPEEVPNLFKRYFDRNAEAQKVNATGKGIGLALSKNIIESHGGTISAASGGKWKGTAFTVELTDVS
ncbi:MAG: ATP-binding protein [Patescibacteria group bacterium]